MFRDLIAQLTPLERAALALVTALLLGAAIGFERQLHQRTAGLRTNVLVAVGAAAFVDPGLRVAGAGGGVKVIAHVVSGMGFLGAGVVMKEGAQVRGNQHGGDALGIESATWTVSTES